MNSPVENIKSRLSIVDVVSSYVKLEKAGANFKGRCPFHNEKSPSFFVSPARNSYHCFGCNRGGDIFTFTEEIEGMNFSEALKHLAERAGVQLSSYSPKEAEETNRLYSLLDEATLFFETELQKFPAVIAYLNKRGLLPETIAQFRIGYVSPEWRTLFFHLRKKGYSESDIEKAGLSIKSMKASQGYFDRFRGRIMFPISDTQGRIVGFSGRVYDNADDPKNAKYVNSPETVLYKKSRILFGYDKAKRSLAERDECILVEGQFDLIMSHQAGTANTVAVSGTALTEEHLLLIKRFTDNLVLAFDADEAGLKAALRGVGLALTLGMDVKITTLPENLDPADFLQKHETEWPNVISRAQHIVLFLLDHILEKKYDERKLRQAIQKEIVPFIARVSNRLDQSFFIKAISNKTGIEENDLREEANKAARNTTEDTYSTPVVETEKNTSQIKREDRALRRLIGLMLWKENDSEYGESLVKAKKRLQETLGENFNTKLNEYTAGKDTLIFEAEMYYQGNIHIADEIEELLANIERTYLETTLHVLLTELRQAEQGTDNEKVEAVLKKCQELSARIHELKKTE